MYELKPTKIFLKQIEKLSSEAKELIEKKLLLTKKNPFRNKKIKGRKLFLFRIRFSDKRKEKRIIYLLEKKTIKLICILNREKQYKDLEKYLKKH